VLTDPVIVAPSALPRAVVRASVPPLRFIISLSSDSYRYFRSLFARPSSTLRRRMYRRSSDAASACLLDFEPGDFIERVTLCSLLPTYGTTNRFNLAALQHLNFSLAWPVLRWYRLSLLR
jgi:hypothetical protein